MKKLLVIALLAGSLSAQELPAAPSASKPISKTSWFLYGLAAGVLVTSDIVDQETTLRGLRAPAGCVEKNGGDPNPSRAKLYAKNLPIDAGLIAFGWWLKRRRIPIAPYAGLGVVTYKHAHGAAEWYTEGCL